MRNKFDMELDKLNDNLLKMGAIIEQSIRRAVEGMFSNEDTFDDVHRLEEKTDELEHEIEGQCMRIILSQQPVASDLRVTSTAMKMVTDMERIADQAVDISEIARHMQNARSVDCPDTISQMAQKAVIMVKKSLDAFVHKDMALAQAVIAADDEVDALFLMTRDAVVAHIRENAENGSVAIDFMMIAKYLERIADHAVNLAEWVVFLVTGMHKNERIL